MAGPREAMHALAGRRPGFLGDVPCPCLEDEVLICGESQLPLRSDSPLTSFQLCLRGRVRLFVLPTRDDGQQLLQVLFTTEERERIQVEAQKSVLGDDRQPTQNPDLINGSFPPCLAPLGTATQQKVWPELRSLYETGPPQGPHRYRPGDWVYVRRYQRQTLQPRWKGRYIVILTTPTALKVDGITPWVHYTHVPPADPHAVLKDFAPEWKSQPDKDNPLKLRLHRSYLPH
ncbi:uncharacterized protein LOC123936937 [Meles meles]|uniref:uncharacterized protein LOC123936937 n=1 Tax=Meles meles TaxID=9662 RepID=UPI001E69C1EC|nr:uncharacterized protein LOC123936937 [Meles meles]